MWRLEKYTLDLILHFIDDSTKCSNSTWPSYSWYSNFLSMKCNFQEYIIGFIKWIFQYRRYWHRFWKGDLFFLCFKFVLKMKPLLEILKKYSTLKTKNKYNIVEARNEIIVFKSAVNFTLLKPKMDICNLFFHILGCLQLVLL